MKKFLSLVLALVMTMSLVTIGASATEYKDLTDKGEIQYAEAVAVLNKLGIITGYEDGSFKPTGALTRGAAAKIIVSLMIGPEAASALAVTAAPYKDVATTNTFAAVISYCKTAGYISGYADGTFRPTGALTGYAFSKMLLGALGYDGTIEGFTGSGWTMNVAKLGNTAGLFNDFATAFKGNDGLTRQEACLLALNTLKATEVEYSGGSNISTNAGNATTNVVVNATRDYKTSNNTNINKNISSATTGNNSNNLTLEFGEEHFSDLKLENARTNSTILDDYGRPSNQWTYKNVEIGTYAKTADYTYTSDASGDTNADKVKDMGLNSYNFDSNTTVYVNGNPNVAVFESGKANTTVNAKMLAGFVKNGTTVQVYLSDTTSNLISQIAIVETQVVQINRVTSKDVTFSRVESSGVAAALNAVKDDDDCYAALKDLKADAFVVVTPLWDSGTTYDVDAVYVPTSVTGKISTVKVDGSGYATGVTVTGTAYKMSFNWTAEDANGDTKSALNATSVSTTQDSTIYLDSFGYVIYAENVKASTDYILLDEFYSNVVDGRIHYFAQGWDMKGNTLSLDVGTDSSVVTSNTCGMVYTYQTASSSSNADYDLHAIVNGGNKTTVVASPNTTWLASKTSIGGGDGSGEATPIYFKDSVKYIFVTFVDGSTTDIDSITVKDGAQEVSNGKLFQYVVDDGKVTAVIIKDDTDVEVSTNVMYVQKETSTTTNSEGKVVSLFTAYIDGVKTTDLVANKRVDKDSFYTYSESNGIYSVNKYATAAGKSTSVLTGKTLMSSDIKNNAYITAGNVYSTVGYDLNLSNAKVIDLRDGGTLSSAKDIYNANGTFTVSLVYNGSSSSSTLGRVAYLFILADGASTASNACNITAVNASVATLAGTALTTVKVVTGTELANALTVSTGATAKVVTATGSTTAVTTANVTATNVVLVTAADGTTTQEYTIALSSASILNAFFGATSGNRMTVSGTTATVVGTVLVSDLTASTGATISVAVSGSDATVLPATAALFSGNVITVTAVDGTSTAYTVA